MIGAPARASMPTSWSVSRRYSPILVCGLSWHGLVCLGEPVLEPSVSELICRADRSQDLTFPSVVKKPEQTYRSLTQAPQLCAG